MRLGRPDPSRVGLRRCGRRARCAGSAGSSRPSAPTRGECAIPYVAINVLTVPAGAGSTLEERFAARQGAVDSAPGFEHLELLRPLEGTEDYLVYTRWRSEADFHAWRESQSFGQGHARASERPAGAGPAATGSTVWAFEVVQSSDGPGAA